MDPGNICLLPDGIKAHPAREDLREKKPNDWYKYDLADHAKVEGYLNDFYIACSEVIDASESPLGFVGGEVCAHQRGYIGVLGVLGLWCHAHSERQMEKCGTEDDVFHHLVIVADCCFAGIWGTALEHIVKSELPCLKEYRELLWEYPVSIQCATDEFEASRGGVFTPLWHFINGNPDNVEKYHKDFLADESDDNFETQHPLYVSTSTNRPSWKCFDDPYFFGYLHGRQLQELEGDLQRGDNGTSPLTEPYVMALQSEASNQCKILQGLLRQLECLSSAGEGLNAFRKSAEQSIITTQQTLAAFKSLLYQAAHRPQKGFRYYVLAHRKMEDAEREEQLREATKRDLLNGASRDKLKELLPVRDGDVDIPPGVYVFQGGEGDMSLIVTPCQKAVILIDGTKTADCFKAAWNSTLRYLRRITHIVVTHHDEDHTFGIQLLLARYYLQPANLPHLSPGTTKIYINTRDDFRPKNFWHEREVVTLAKSFLDIPLEAVIIDDCESKSKRLVTVGDFFLEALLPRQSLVDDVRGKVPERGKETKPVSSRGGTTAANVLSINLVAVWKNRDAYLFTGDAHLKDVTEAAQDFLADNPEIKFFKYVDVPHHGSARSNSTKVPGEHLGLRGIPAEQYLISHCGNRQNPSFQTVKEILQSKECRVLHFLYRERGPSTQKNHPKNPPGVCCKECKVGYTDETKKWHCDCACMECDEVQAKINLPLEDEKHKYFPFADP